MYIGSALSYLSAYSAFVLRQKTVIKSLCILTAKKYSLFLGGGRAWSKSIVHLCGKVGGQASPLVSAAVQAIFLPQLFVLFCARTAKRQCCLGSQAASRCLAGINAAKAGDVCQENASDKCGIDAFKVSTYDQTMRQKGQMQFMALHHHIWPEWCCDFRKIDTRISC